MNRFRFQDWATASALAGALAGALAMSTLVRAQAHESSAAAVRPNVVVSVYATGLNNPRGLKFGPDRHLYVAEGGIGGDNSTIGQCDQVPGAGPYTGSPTGSRISRINSNGDRVTVVDNIPSSQTAPIPSKFVSGVADIAFIDGTMYALLAGGGRSHGVVGAKYDNGVARVNRDGTWTLIANLSAFQKANPVAKPEPDDFEPDGTWWGMVAVRGDLYAVEPNHGEMDKITTRGKISRVVDISATQGHVVPTAIAYHGNFHVSNLGRFDPEQLNKQSVFKITPSGQLRVVATGLSKVLGLAFEKRDRLYVLESSYSTTDPGPQPGTGRLIRLEPNGKQTILIDSTSGLLFFPTGMTFGPDGALYVSNVGFGPPPVGLGLVLRIELPDAD
jgi:hypothetical protein